MQQFEDFDKGETGILNANERLVGRHGIEKCDNCGRARLDRLIEEASVLRKDDVAGLCIFDIGSASDDSSLIAFDVTFHPARKLADRQHALEYCRFCSGNHCRFGHRLFRVKSLFTVMPFVR